MAEEKPTPKTTAWAKALDEHTELTFSMGYPPSESKALFGKGAQTIRRERYPVKRQKGGYLFRKLSVETPPKKQPVCYLNPFVK